MKTTSPLLESQLQRRIAPPTQGGTSLPEIEVAPGEAEKNLLAYFGAMRLSLGKLLELVPLGGDAYYLMRECTINGTVLTSGLSTSVSGSNAMDA